jgi:hypothetical protein
MKILLLFTLIVASRCDNIVMNANSNYNFVGLGTVLNGRFPITLIRYHAAITSASNVVVRRGTTSEYIIQEGRVCVGNPVPSIQDKCLDFFQRNVFVHPLFSINNLQRHNVAVIVLDYAFRPSNDVGIVGIVENWMTLPPIGTSMPLILPNFSPQQFTTDLALSRYSTDTNDRSIVFVTEGFNSQVSRGNPIMWTRFTGWVVYSLSLNSTISPRREVNGIILLDYSNWINEILSNNI